MAKPLASFVTRGIIDAEHMHAWFTVLRWGEEIDTRQKVHLWISLDLDSEPLDVAVDLHETTTCASPVHRITSKLLPDNLEQTTFVFPKLAANLLGMAQIEIAPRLGKRAHEAKVAGIKWHLTHFPEQSCYRYIAYCQLT